MHTYVKEEEVAPYFQPIVSLQTRSIVGYETLGRRHIEGGVESLGPFFQNPDISDASHLKIDRLLREKAIRQVTRLDPDQQLFINLKPSWIYKQYKESGRLRTLELIEQYGVNPEQVVIEITEEDFNGNLSELTEIVNIYKQKGCTIAVDDVGSGFSNFDRIALIRPKILKMDLNILKKGASHEGYKALMRSFSILSSQIGASLLAEGVETQRDLYNALQVGARYVQGYLFAKAEPDFMPRDRYASMLHEELSLFSSEEFSKFQQLMALEDQFENLFASDMTLHDPEKADRLIESVMGMMYANCIRMYICQEDGIQVSSNYTRELGEAWRRDRQFRGSNWVWRPYFIGNIIVMNKRGKGILSSEYTDLDSSCLIQTYSFPLGNGYYMFLDLAI